MTHATNLERGMEAEKDRELLVYLGMEDIESTLLTIGVIISLLGVIISFCFHRKQHIREQRRDNMFKKDLNIIIRQIPREYAIGKNMTECIIEVKIFNKCLTTIHINDFWLHIVDEKGACIHKLIITSALKDRTIKANDAGIDGQIKFSIDDQFMDLIVDSSNYFLKLTVIDDDKVRFYSNSFKPKANRIIR